MVNFRSFTLGICCSTTFVLMTSCLTLTIPRVDSRIEKHDAAGATVNIFAKMREGTGKVLAEISLTSFTSGADKRTALHAALVQNAAESQAPLLTALFKATVTKAQVISFWITNEIYIRNADARVVDLLRKRQDVSSVHKEETYQIPTNTEEDEGCNPRGGYNLELIGVPQVWELGVNGSGVVVASIGTGVSHTHEAVRDSYKNDTHSWFDALSVPNSQIPVDDHGSGTRLIGVAVGGRGAGVAFGSKWIACKAFDSSGLGIESTVKSCGQFVVRPWRPDGSDIDSSQAPHVVLNPWTWTGSEQNLELMVNAWHGAGIIPIFSASNGGNPGCGSIAFPAWLNVISVGATNQEDKLSNYSGWGPNPRDNTIKPEITAPGVGICGASHMTQDGYVLLPLEEEPGAAAAHVAGVIALLLGVAPCLGYEDVKEVLELTAATNLGCTGEMCDQREDCVVPNFQFGHGRLDALAAYNHVREHVKCLGEPGQVPWVIIASVAGGVLLLAIPVLFWWRVKRAKRARAKANAATATKKEVKLEDILSQFRSGDLPPLTVSEMELDVGHEGASLKSVGNYLALTEPYDYDQYEIPRGNLQIDEKHILGAGEFGIVLAAVLLGNKDSVPVAVKRLKSSTSPRRVVWLLKELQIMIYVARHEHIVQLVGACTHSSTVDDVCIVLQLCANGTLQKYLRACRQVFEGNGQVEAMELCMPRHERLLQWTTEVARGMEFLATRRVIHGDLAARNVLLDSHLVAKISDFGLASRLYEYTKYVRAEGRPLPWRWMAIESLLDMRFSHASDVWSFGITAWEIFSLAETPYPATLWTPQFVQYLQAGHRNTKPEHATEEVFALLQQCWLAEATSRPTMARIVELLGAMRSKPQRESTVW